MAESLVEQYDGILLDLDGVLYAGHHAIPGAVETVSRLVEHHIPVGYVTNNASRSAGSVADHLNELGIPAREHEVFGSAPAGVALMTQSIPKGSPVLVTGSDYLREQVTEADYRVVESAAQHPAAVIQGFDPSLGWTDLAEAAYAINSGAEWFATNLDLSIPREKGIAPGNGALAAAISHATGKHPVAAGKPEPVLFHQAAQALGMEQPLMIGDRLDTDILGANRAGFSSALVLTGVDGETTALHAPPELTPEWVLEDLYGLFDGSHRRFNS